MHIKVLGNMIDSPREILDGLVGISDGCDAKIVTPLLLSKYGSH